MRVLIVDDEAPARARLRRLLAPHVDVEVVGEAADADSALHAAATLAPELLLLDVQMPGPSGLDVAASLPEPAPAVVFVTAFDRYALPAFDAAAVDYLLKPVAPERLARALDRVRERCARHAVAPSPACGTALALRCRLTSRQRWDAGAGGRGVGAAAADVLVPAQLLIPDRGRTHVVPLAEILWLEAADNYVVVHTAQRAPLLRRPLTALLPDLGGGFVRCHRGAAVALAHVQQLVVRDKGDATVVLRGGGLVPCSRGFRAELVARLHGSASAS